MNFQSLPNDLASQKIVKIEQDNHSRGRPLIVALVIGTTSVKSSIVHGLTRLLRKKRQVIWVSARRELNEVPRGARVLNQEDDNVEEELNKVIKYRGESPDVLIVLNELMGFFEEMPVIEKIMRCGRYFNASLIVSEQYARCIPPKVRNFDMILMCRTSTLDEHKLYEIYGYLPKQAFRKLLHESTTDFGALVIEQSIKTPCEPFCFRARMYKERSKSWANFRLVTMKSEPWRWLGRDLIEFLSEYFYTYNF